MSGSGSTQALTVALSSVLLPRAGILSADALDARSAPVELDLVDRLGRKGQRYNTRSTLLALAAVEEISVALAARGDALDGSCALVAASCYGNLAATCGVAEQLKEHGVDQISPMDLPNASSNILASQIAIRHHLTGVCLTVDDGHRSGASAMRWARRLIAAGRASRVLVVAAECPSIYEETLRGGRPLIEGAIALLLESRVSSEAPDSDDEVLREMPTWMAEYELASLGGLMAPLCERVGALG